jgi:UDP-glucuronate 4-epimerase
MAVFAVGDARSGSVKRVGAAIEAATGLRAKCNFMAMQQGDIPVTFADTSPLRALTGFAPKTLVEESVNRFVAWYRDYCGV